MISIRYFSPLMVMLVPMILETDDAWAAKPIACHKVPLVTSSGPLHKPIKKCWKHRGRGVDYFYVHAEQNNGLYHFVGFSSAGRSTAMSYETNVRKITKTTAPTTYKRSKNWSKQLSIKTKYRKPATYASFTSGPYHCIGFVQYIRPQNGAYKHLFSGIKCNVKGITYSDRVVRKMINEIRLK